MRYVIVTFFFLGWIFYHMSGGADFNAEATRLARTKSSLDPDQNPIEPVRGEIDIVIPENTHRISLDLNRAQDVVGAAIMFPNEEITQPEGLKVKRILKNEEPPAEFLPSLVGENSADSERIVIGSITTDINFSNTTLGSLSTLNNMEQESFGTALDIRSVTGKNVNVRGGPGINFTVINQLTLGDRVEVLQDLGNGWIQMRLLDESTTGWMASFLLSDG